MKVKLTNWDIIWSYVGVIMSMGANLILLPFLLYYLDTDMYGLWSVFVSIGAIATLFDCGFAVTFARNITYCWSGAECLKKRGVIYTNNSEPNFSLMKKVLITCKSIYLYISSIALVLMLVFGSLYIKKITYLMEGREYYVAWCIYAIAVFLNLYYGYYTSFLRGVGAVGQANINMVIARFIQILFTIILLFFGLGIIGASIGYLLYGTILRLLGKHKFYQYKNIGTKLAEVQEKPTKNDKKELLSIVWHNAWRDGIISICEFICNQSAIIICSLYLSLSETGMYSLSVQIASAVAQISGVLYNAYQPELQSSVLSKNEEKTRKIMSIIIVTYIYISIIMYIVVLCIGLPILKIVKPEIGLTYSIMIGLGIYQFILKYRNCYTSYFSCTNRIIYLKGFMISSVLCISSSVFVCGYLKMGIWGLIGSQIISQLVYNAWHWSIKAHQELKLDAKKIFVIGNQEIMQMARTIFRKVKG